MRSLFGQSDRVRIVCNCQLLDLEWMLHRNAPAGRRRAMLIVNLLHFDAVALPF